MASCNYTHSRFAQRLEETEKVGGVGERTYSGFETLMKCKGINSCSRLKNKRKRTHEFVL